MGLKIDAAALPEKLLAGVSGGADSVALLLLLKQQGKQVTAVHVNHGLRGKDSDEDERFVRALCHQHQVPLLVYRAVPPAHPSENWAREARYGFFREAMRETGIAALALAHHQDDQAETLLLHLLRGAGLTGLCGMAADSVHPDGLRILRPLLGVPRNTLRDFLREQRQSWREDATNGDNRFLRNAIRLEVLPLLEQLAPGASRRLAETAKLLQADEEVLTEQTQCFLRLYGAGREMPLAPLMQEPSGVQKRILRAWWQAQSGTGQEATLSARQTEEWCSLLSGAAGSRCNLPFDWHGVRGWTHMHLIPPEERTSIPEQPLAGCGIVSIHAGGGATGDGCTTQAFPASWIGEVTVRSRRAGDWIRPFGMKGKQTLQDYLVNRRVDAPFRDRIPLVCRDSEVLWAVGVGAGGVPRMNELDDTVLLRCTADCPWSMKQKDEGGNLL